MENDIMEANLHPPKSQDRLTPSYLCGQTLKQNTQAFAVVVRAQSEIDGVKNNTNILAYDIDCRFVMNPKLTTDNLIEIKGIYQ